eukprot:m.152103 g.152103  ORF g.152103 m.152103 type:complete len:323 (+) comp16913_c0_seq1:281-1249(+)
MAQRKDGATAPSQPTSQPASPTKGPLTEERRKMKMALFLADQLRVGCVKGFKYFRMYLRGREELIVTIRNEQQTRAGPPTPIPDQAQQHQMYLQQQQQQLLQQQQAGRPRVASNSIDDSGTLQVTSRTQKRLTGFEYAGAGLPPASPAERETLAVDAKYTNFLIAAYARYGGPYVWVRSNHERMFKLGGDPSANRDSPLKLRSTNAWTTNDVKVWDVIAELVDICMQPPASNPFAIDMNYFESLPILEAVMTSGAMVHFMQRVLDSCRHTYDKQIMEEMTQLLVRHYEFLAELRDSELFPDRVRRPRVSMSEVEDIPVPDYL